MASVSLGSNQLLKQLYKDDMYSWQQGGDHTDFKHHLQNNISSKQLQNWP